MGLLDFLQSKSEANSSSGSRDDWCYDRWEKELERCKNLFWPMENKRPWAACKVRANDRYSMCVRNRGKAHPDEPDEFDFNDIPKDMP